MPREVCLEGINHLPKKHPDLFSTSCHQRHRRRTEPQDSDGERNGLWLPQSRTLQDGDLLSMRRTRSLSQTGSISMSARPTTTYGGHPLETRKRDNIYYELI